MEERTAAVEGYGLVKLPFRRLQAPMVYTPQAQAVPFIVSGEDGKDLSIVIDFGVCEGE